ncbi:MAG: DUF721 domain-containing protein [Candidatus Kapaibacterium sp.]|jgi:predicted nucleic acid-binding Zn ribbon protein|nr:DUF721 domain-containing protein [Candidatus Kapabacteria bacterium]
MMLYDRPVKNLQDLIEQLVEKMGWEEEFELANIRNNWKDIVGTRFADESKAVELKDGLLLVESESSVWRAELFYRKQEIIEKINSMKGYEIVKEMVFR